MDDKRIQVGGAVIFWRLSKGTKASDVHRGLSALGLEKFCPEPRTPGSCLRAALEDAFPAPKDEKRAIRPIENGFAVVADDSRAADPGDPWGRVIAKATLVNDRVELMPYDSDKLDQIRDSMCSVAEWFTAASAGKSLVKLIEHHGGVPLRPNGAIYWLNQEHLNIWSQVAGVFEGAGGRNAETKEAETKVYMLRVVADEQMVSAVGDALTAEIEAACQMIEEELADGNLGTQACQNRIMRAGDLLKKVRRYEQAFGKPMQVLTEAIERAGTSLAMATLQQSAASHQPLTQSFASVV